MSRSDEELTFLLEFLKSFTDSGSQLDPLLLTVPATVPSGLTPVFGVKGVPAPDHTRHKAWLALR